MLIHQLKDEDDVVSRDAAKKLGDLGDPRAVEPLIVCLNGQNLLARSEALKSLVKIGKPAVYPLIGFLKSGTLYMRPKVSAALVKLGKPTVIPLISCLKDKSNIVRYLAADALGDIRDKIAVEPLINCLNDKYPDVVSSAASALGKIGDTRAIEPLIGCLKDKNEGSTNITDAIGKIGGNQTVKLLIEYLNSLNENDWISRRNAIDALSKIKEPGIDSIVEILRTKDLNLRNSLAIAQANICDHWKMGPLIAKLKDKNITVRKNAATALGDFNDKRAIPYLVSAMPDCNAQFEICMSLMVLGWKPSTDAEQVYDMTGKQEWNQLRANWVLTKRVLLNDIKSGNRNKIENAVFTFITLGEEEIIVELIKILNSKGDKVLAETYLNCGQHQLYEAANKWASRHGYNINSGSGSHNATWGGKR